MRSIGTACGSRSRRERTIMRVIMPRQGCWRQRWRQIAPMIQRGKRCYRTLHRIRMRTTMMRIVVPRQGCWCQKCGKIIANWPKVHHRVTVCLNKAGKGLDVMTPVRFMPQYRPNLWLSAQAWTLIMPQYRTYDCLSLYASTLIVKGVKRTNLTIRNVQWFY